jgi:hypothetical protein
VTDEPRIRGLSLSGPQSAATVNIVLPMLVGPDGAEHAPAKMFALAHWVLPRVPCIGEEIIVETVGYGIPIEAVAWGIRGGVSVRLREIRALPEVLGGLENEGWSTGPWETEPPADWLTYPK